MIKSYGVLELGISTTVGNHVMSSGVQLRDDDLENEQNEHGNQTHDGLCVISCLDVQC